MHQVLHLVGTLGKATAQKSPQVRTQLFQKSLVCGAIGRQAQQQEVSKLFFYLHAFSMTGYSQPQPRRLQQVEKISSGFLWPLV
ncbi:hypothetical protein [Acidovorax sp. 106]|uniref:hypothetical protein n=1 Tax=Acidovorax sp. 106 TaxID=2135637 RepID=UPI001F282E94|nr:hypothetical protein [Acidovorax sp. 106]